MKVAVLTSSYPRFQGDGTAPFVKSIAEKMAQMGHQVDVIAPYDPEVRTIDEKGVHIHRFRYVWPDRYHIMGHARSLDADVRLRPLAFFLLPLFLLSAFINLLRVVRRQNSEIIHVHWVIPNGLVAAWVAGMQRIPFVVSLHGSDIYLARRNRVFGVFTRWIFKRAAGVTACSPELRQTAIQLGASDETVLIAWGADPEIFHPDKKMRERYFGQGQTDEVIVAALGRLVYKKGFRVLLDAMIGVLRDCPRVRLVMGGDGPLRAELSTQADQLGISERVTFTGRVPWDEVPAFLAAAHIFALPSIRDEYGNVDGLPTVLLEAMSSGNAVVASDIGGVSQVIEDGKTGMLVPPGDIKALTHALLQLASDQQKRLDIGLSARQAVEDTFNWDSVCRQLIDLFEAATWRPSHRQRLGTLYRSSLLSPSIKIEPLASVLDIGCHDGYYLSTLKARKKVGIDLEIVGKAHGIDFIIADGCSLPIENRTFDIVFALDVIEHVLDDRHFAESILRVVAPGGRLIVTTPSLNIRLYPPFLTKWISRKWGHTLRLGYTASQLEGLFKCQDFELRIQTWNAPAYRFWYLPLRTLSRLLPGLSARLVKGMAKWDAKHSNGEHGFLLLEAIRIKE